MSTPETPPPSNPYGATYDDVLAACEMYGVTPPSPASADALLSFSARDVERFCGCVWADRLQDLSEPQTAALRQATAVQASFRSEQGDLMLGSDDGLASSGTVSFSLRPLPRFSTDAAERLSGLGLITRAPMASDPSADPVDAA